MYVGRIVAIGTTPAGRAAAMYRVSSRSFPNREARAGKAAVSVMPLPGYEDDLKKNPYIAYNCLRLTGFYAVVSNGSHTDAIAERLASGMAPRDALALVLQALDYEHDQLDTPRIAGVVDRTEAKGWLGIVRKDALLVREFALVPGQAFYLATYEHNAPSERYADANFAAQTAAEACEHVMRGGVFAGLEKPVTAAAAVDGEQGFTIAVG